MASQMEKKEEYRKYLEETKVVEELTKVVGDLYEEEPRPKDALSYLVEKITEAMKMITTPTGAGSAPTATGVEESDPNVEDAMDD